LKWKKRLAEIEFLRDKYGRGKSRKSPIVAPSLKVDQRGVSPCTNLFGNGRSPKRDLPPDAIEFPIGNCHKSGLQLITPGQIANGELKYLGGKKF
jgi:hypothetical protein